MHQEGVICTGATLLQMYYIRKPAKTVTMSTIRLCMACLEKIKNPKAAEALINTRTYYKVYVYGDLVIVCVESVWSKLTEPVYPHH
jgi:DTW domain-containing protein YfiP